MTKTKTHTAASAEISIKEACEILNVTKPTVYAHIRKGNLHPIKKAVGVGVGGRRVFLSRAEVETLRTAAHAAPGANGATEKNKRAPKTPK